jgi:5-methylcytosine-specific restriction endonuclease McrA
MVNLKDPEIQKKRVLSRQKNGWWKNPKERREKASRSLVGKNKGKTAWNKNKKADPLLIQRMVNTRKEKGNYSLTNEQKEQRRKTALDNHFGTWMTGRKRSKESIDKQREKISGQKNYQWIEDRSILLYPKEFDRQFKDLIRKRDNYKCFLCNKKQEEQKSFLNVHHIDYDKKNLNPKNLISLCRSCHSKTNTNRKWWIEFFNQKLI